MTRAPGLTTLFDEAQLKARVCELGARISADYRGQSLVLLCVLKGSYLFAADLSRAIDLDLRVEFLGVRSYGDSTRSSGVVEITQDLSAPIEGENVLIVEDIVDTGLTVDYLLRQLESREPKSLRLCSLLHKPARTQKDVRIDYLGFTIEDVFVVGYGLDHAQRYRNLPEICVLAGASEPLM